MGTPDDPYFSQRWAEPRPKPRQNPSIKEAEYRLIEAVREAVAHPDLPPLFREVMEKRLRDLDEAMGG